MLVIVDDQPLPALGDNPGDAFTVLERTNMDKVRRVAYEKA